MIGAQPAGCKRADGEKGKRKQPFKSPVPTGLIIAVFRAPRITFLPAGSATRSGAPPLPGDSPRSPPDSPVCRGGGAHLATPADTIGVADGGRSR